MRHQMFAVGESYRLPAGSLTQTILQCPTILIYAICSLAMSCWNMRKNTYFGLKDMLLWFIWPQNHFPGFFFQSILILAQRIRWHFWIMFIYGLFFAWYSFNIHVWIAWWIVFLGTGMCHVPCTQRFLQILKILWGYYVQ